MATAYARAGRRRAVTTWRVAVAAALVIFVSIAAG
jgi:hypothetical protein